MVSVIIPTFNRGYIVAEAIESVLSQTYRDFEIIVVDDGSTDNTREVLEPYRDRIRYFYQENKGVAGARNKGIEESRGAFIAFLDSDDIWLPEKLERQRQLFDHCPELGLVYTRFWRVYYGGQKKKLEPKDKYLKKGYIYPQVLFTYLIWAGSVMARKDCFNRVGRFNTSLPLVQDRDMWLRIAREFKISFVNEPLVINRIQKDTVWASTSDTQRPMPEKEEMIRVAYRRFTRREKIRYFLTYRFKLSTEYAKGAKSNLKAAKYSVSKRLYYKAILYYPFRFKYWRGLIKSLKPVKGY